uniref:Uncharacterized protein n=1 Tax=Rhizophora mucronata TaxID=61149 RepID=A0A2P2QJM9_RHIMU
MYCTERERDTHRHTEIYMQLHQHHRDQCHNQQPQVLLTTPFPSPIL